MYQVMVESFVNGDDSINYRCRLWPSQHKGICRVIDSLNYSESERQRHLADPGI
jgi:hypothetical protein